MVVTTVRPLGQGGGCDLAGSAGITSEVGYGDVFPQRVEMIGNGSSDERLTERQGSNHTLPQQPGGGSRTPRETHRSSQPVKTPI